MRKSSGVICMVLLAVSLFAQETMSKTKSGGKSATEASNPYNGTWKFNPAKSHFSDPASAIKSLTVNVKAGNSKFDWSTKGANAAGPMNLTYTGATDGKPHPLAGDPNAKSIAYTKTENNGLNATWKDAKGNVVLTQSIAMSSDKNTVTIETKAMGKDGKESTATEVYERSSGMTHAAKKAPAKKEM